MDTIWDIEKIQSILPQRYPFLLVDRVVGLDLPAKKIVCLKNLSITEQFFNGHFPNKPVMPGVLITEAMAQAGILLFAALKPEIAEKNPDYYLGKVEIKFLKPVVPGDQLLLEITAEKLTASAGICSADAIVNNQKAATGKIMFSIKA